MAQLFHFGPYVWISFGVGLPAGRSSAGRGGQTQDFYNLVWLLQRIQNQRESTRRQGWTAD